MPSVGGTHHVKIAGDYYLIRPGSYRKRPAPVFGARFTTGDPDFNSLSFWQHWVQHCWVGGFGAEAWQDDAMYHEGVGVDASQHEVMVLSRDLGPSDRSTNNWNLDEGESPRLREFVVFNNTLYILSVGDADATPPSRLYKWTGTAWSLIKTFSTQVPSAAAFGAYLVFGSRGANLDRMDTSETFTTFAKPAGGYSEPAYTLRVFRGKLYAGFGNYIFRLKGDFTWDGSTPFYTAEDIEYNNVDRTGLIISDTHLGFLYFASSNGHILRTDGNNTFDLWAFEPHVKIWGMRSFDGRLFIGASEDLAGTNSAQAVLYQFSGAAVTELKRWGKIGFDCVPGRLRAFGASLFFGAPNQLGFGDGEGFGIARYDPIEDAYHLFAMNQDAVTYTGGTEGILRSVDDVMFFKGYLYCLVAGYGVFRTPWSFQDVTRFQATYDTTAAGGSVGSQNGGWFTSSDFDAGTPGLMKLWNTITIHVDLPTTACTVYAEISSDGGATWYPAGGSAASATVSKTGAATRYSKAIKLQDSAVTGDGWFSTRLKYRLTLRTTDTTVCPQLRGVVVRYLPIPEPNWVWDMVLVLSDDQELLDGTRDAPNNATKLLNLETAFRDQSLINFVDVDGVSWASSNKEGVLIQNMESNLPYIGPGTEGALEREVRIQLIEAIEAYEV